LVKICRECELRELKPQETLFSEGDVGVHFFVLIKGTVDVYVGGKGCINSHHNQGSFGELALLQVMQSVCFAPATSANAGKIAFCRNRASAPHL
jgi:CRP-like cAMP-binding protein